MPQFEELMKTRPHTADELQHLTVLMEALELFIERSTTRGNMWRQFPVSDKIRELRERVVRLENLQNVVSTIGRERVAPGMRNDLIDIINYAVFAVKQIDEGAEL